MNFCNLKYPCILPQKFNAIIRVEILSAPPGRSVLADRRYTGAETRWCVVSRFSERRQHAKLLQTVYNFVGFGMADDIIQTRTSGRHRSTGIFVCGLLHL